MGLAGVDLNLLVALDALLAERSVTRAAERVGLSQPGMSNTLARLRKLFGDPLLVREGLTLVPTPRAESLRQPVADALSLIQHALDDRPGFDPAADQATFTVSCSDYSLLMLIGPLVRRLAAAAPGLTIQVLPRAPDPVRLLRGGDVLERRIADDQLLLDRAERRERGPAGPTRDRAARSPRHRRAGHCRQDRRDCAVSLQVDRRTGQ